MTNRNLTTTVEHGELSGFNAFDDQVGIPDLNKTAITSIVVTHDSHIRSLTVHYNNKVGVTRGSVDSTANTVSLTPGEWITKIEGAHNAAMTMLSFVTNKGTQWGPYGQASSVPTFTWNEFGPYMGLLYFTGRADTYIRGLSATFGRYPGHEELTSVVKYEEQVDSDPDVQCIAPLSKFTLNLMARTVTLLIGPDNVEFHVSQMLLCSLPFFRAALQGEFREAAEQQISMPEDESQHVSAMIEFLYTGGYTYAHTPRQGVESGTPPADLTEGTFHVGVYATAYKYDCQDLVKASLLSFIGVLRRLESIEVIRLWKVAYDNELLLSKVEEDPNLVEFRGGLVALLKELYVTHLEEIYSTSVDHPTLIADLLRLVVSG